MLLFPCPFFFPVPLLPPSPAFPLFFPCSSPASLPPIPPQLPHLPLLFTHKKRISAGVRKVLVAEPVEGGEGHAPPSCAFRPNQEPAAPLGTITFRWTQSSSYASPIAGSQRAPDAGPCFFFPKPTTPNFPIIQSLRRLARRSSLKSLVAQRFILAGSRMGDGIEMQANSFLITPLSQHKKLSEPATLRQTQSWM